MKNICPTKDIIKNVERQSTQWEKIFTYHICNMGLIPRIVRTLRSQKQRQTIQIKNGQRTWKNTLEAGKIFCLWDGGLGTEEVFLVYLFVFKKN